MSISKKNIRLIVLLAILFALSLIPIINLVSQKIADKKSGLRTIVVAQYSYVFNYMPLYLADLKGYFRDEGLKIEYVSTNGDEKTYYAVIGGSADFGIADPSFVAIAQEKELQGKVVGGIVNGVPFWAITNKDIPQITDGAMLQPYSVATYQEPSTAFAVQKKMFQDAGLKPNIVQGSFGGILHMLESGEADIAIELEPNISTAVARGAKTVYSFGDRYPEFAFTGITTKSTTIENDPDLVQHFVNAITRAEMFAHQYPDSAAFYMCRQFPDLSQDVVYSAVNRMVESNALPSNAVVSDKAWFESLKLRQEIGDLKSLQGKEECLDMRFAVKSNNDFGYESE